MNYINFNKRQDDDHQVKNSTFTTTATLLDNNSTSTASPQQQHHWIMCDQATAAQDTSTLGYNCERRPYMTVILLLSILVFIILRKSNFIKKLVSSNEAKEGQTDEEEGLMQRVF